MRRLLPMIFATLLCTVASSCDDDSGPNVGTSPESEPETCKPFAGPNVEYLFSTSCHVLVMTCTYCSYGADGKFKKTSTSACGVCIGGDL